MYRFDFLLIPGGHLGNLVNGISWNGNGPKMNGNGSHNASHRAPKRYAPLAIMDAPTLTKLVSTVNGTKDGTSNPGIHFTIGPNVVKVMSCKLRRHLFVQTTPNPLHSFTTSVLRFLKCCVNVGSYPLEIARLILRSMSLAANPSMPSSSST